MHMSVFSCFNTTADSFTMEPSQDILMEEKSKVRSSVHIRSRDVKELMSIGLDEEIMNRFVKRMYGKLAGGSDWVGALRIFHKDAVELQRVFPNVSQRDAHLNLLEARCNVNKAALLCVAQSESNTLLAPSESLSDTSSSRSMSIGICSSVRSYRNENLSLSAASRVSFILPPAWAAKDNEKIRTTLWRHYAATIAMHYPGLMQVEQSHQKPRIEDTERIVHIHIDRKTMNEFVVLRQPYLWKSDAPPTVGGSALVDDARALFEEYSQKGWEVSCTTHRAEEDTEWVHIRLASGNPLLPLPADAAVNSYPRDKPWIQGRCRIEPAVRVDVRFMRDSAEYLWRAAQCPFAAAAIDAGRKAFGDCVTLPLNKS